MGEPGYVIKRGARGGINKDVASSHWAPHHHLHAVVTSVLALCKVHCDELGVCYKLMIKKGMIISSNVSRWLIRHVFFIIINSLSSHILLIRDKKEAWDQVYPLQVTLQVTIDNYIHHQGFEQLDSTAGREILLMSRLQGLNLCRNRSSRAEASTFTLWATSPTWLIRQQALICHSVWYIIIQVSQIIYNEIKQYY